MNYDFEHYQMVAKNKLADWLVEDNDAVRVLAGALAAKRGQIYGGSFAQAVISNDLLNAVTHADKKTLKYIKEITIIVNNF